MGDLTKIIVLAVIAALAAGCERSYVQTTFDIDGEEIEVDADAELTGMCSSTCALHCAAVSDDYIFDIRWDSSFVYGPGTFDAMLDDPSDFVDSVVVILGVYGDGAFSGPSEAGTVTFTDLNAFAGISDASGTASGTFEGLVVTHPTNGTTLRAASGEFHCSN